MKKIISTKLHGMLDYACGFILILPWAVNYFGDKTDTGILALLGMLTILASLITNYELGIIKLIPMKLHLAVDTLQALFLIAIPFIFPLHHYLFYWPVFFGIAELIIILCSSSEPFKKEA